MSTLSISIKFIILYQMLQINLTGNNSFKNQETKFLEKHFKIFMFFPVTFPN